MRSILLHIRDDRCLKARAQVAFDLARAFEGHVSCLQAVPYNVGVPSDFMSAAMTQILPLLKEQAAELRQKMESRLTKEDASWAWIEQDGSAAYRIPQHALLNDLVVMGACNDVGGEDAYSSLAAKMCLTVDAPVMLVPEASTSFDADAPVIIAWNGSAEACQAIKAALPLLQRASTVFLMSVEEHSDRDRFPNTAAARYLARHDIKAELSAESMLKDGIAATLNEQARRRAASCIIMGAYGHSRVRELVLGGVTRQMMKTSEVPLLFAH